MKHKHKHKLKEGDLMKRLPKALYEKVSDLCLSEYLLGYALAKVEHEQRKSKKAWRRVVKDREALGIRVSFPFAKKSCSRR